MSLSSCFLKIFCANCYLCIQIFFKNLKNMNFSLWSCKIKFWKNDWDKQYSIKQIILVALSTYWLGVFKIGRIFKLLSFDGVEQQTILTLKLFFYSATFLQKNCVFIVYFNAKLHLNMLNINQLVDFLKNVVFIYPLIFCKEN